MIYKCGFNVQNDDLFSESSATDSAGDSEEEDPLSKTQLFRLTVFLATRSNATISSMGDTLKGVIGILFDEDNERSAHSLCLDYVIDLNNAILPSNAMYACRLIVIMRVRLPRVCHYEI
eukprot:591883_1